MWENVLNAFKGTSSEDLVSTGYIKTQCTQKNQVYNHAEGAEGVWSNAACKALGSVRESSVQPRFTAQMTIAPLVWNPDKIPCLPGNSPHRLLFPVSWK